MIEEFHEGIIVVSEEGKSLFRNKAFDSLFGNEIVNDIGQTQLSCKIKSLTLFKQRDNPAEIPITRLGYSKENGFKEGSYLEQDFHSFTKKIVTMFKRMKQKDKQKKGKFKIFCKMIVATQFEEE